MKAWDYLQEREILPVSTECIKSVRWEHDYIWLENGQVIRSMRDGRYLEDTDQSWWTQCHIGDGESVEFTNHYVKL